LKKAILHRKNALFYKTQNGAHVGDLFMSLIYTCQLCGANTFAYLIELQQHSDELSRSPQEWMPWNYREASNGLRGWNPPAIAGRQESPSCLRCSECKRGDFSVRRPAEG
jgi:hypothetical protein